MYFIPPVCILSMFSGLIFDGANVTFTTLHSDISTFTFLTAVVIFIFVTKILSSAMMASLPVLTWWWHIYNQQLPPQSCYPVFCPTEHVFLWSCRLRMNSWCIKLQCLAVITSFYALIVLLNLLFDVRELVLQVLTPLPFFQICGILRTRKKKDVNYMSCPLSEYFCSLYIFISFSFL